MAYGTKSHRRLSGRMETEVVLRVPREFLDDVFFGPVIYDSLWLWLRPHHGKSFLWAQSVELGPVTWGSFALIAARDVS